MKVWKSLAFISLLICPLVLSSCDLLGIGGKSKEEEYYEKQIEFIKQQQEANQKAQEEYNEQIRKALEEYTKQYAEYQQAQLEAQIAAAEEALKDQQQEPTEEIPYN